VDSRSTRNGSAHIMDVCATDAHTPTTEIADTKRTTRWQGAGTYRHNDIYRHAYHPSRIVATGQVAHQNHPNTENHKCRQEIRT
jgi:predicted GH43/DUF377 family glycosyl hydrolase